MALVSGCAGYGYGLYPPPPPGQPETVAVTLREFSIDAWPRLVRKGRVVLDVTNFGGRDHTLNVVGPGVREELGEDVGPGEQRRLSLVLGVGRYRLTCPDSDHGRRGMDAIVDVEETTTWFRR